MSYFAFSVKHGAQYKRKENIEMDLSFAKCDLQFETYSLVKNNQPMKAFINFGQLNKNGAIQLSKNNFKNLSCTLHLEQNKKGNLST